MRRTRGDTRRLFFLELARADLAVEVFFAVEDFVVETFAFGEVDFDFEDGAGDGALVSDWNPLAREGAHTEPHAIPSAIHRTDVRESNTARNLPPEVGAHHCNVVLRQATHQLGLEVIHTRCRRVAVTLFESRAALIDILFQPIV